MNVLLIQSYTHSSPPVFPIGLVYIASALMNEHDIEICDPNLEDKPWVKLKEKLEAVKPDIVGISLRNVDSVEYPAIDSYYPDFLKMIDMIKTSGFRKKIIVGGSGFSLYAGQILEDCPEIDIGVYLEGEETVKELLANLDRPDKVKGCFISNGSDVLFTGHRQFIPLDGIARPAYELFDLDRYQSRGRGIGIETKRGCYFRCLYCPYPFLSGKELRLRNAGDVVDEMQFLHQRYGVQAFSFVDSVFNVPVSYAEEICNEITSRGLKFQWSSYTDIKGFTERYARSAMAAGCVAFPFSVDAFSDKALRIMGKTFTQQDIFKAVEVAEKIDGIDVGYQFFLDPPGTSLKDIFSLFAFLVKIKWKLKGKMKKLFSVNRIRIEPHTRVFDMAVEEGIIQADTNLMKPVFYSEPRIRLFSTVVHFIFMALVPLARVRRFMRKNLSRRRGRI